MVTTAGNVQMPYGYSIEKKAFAKTSRPEILFSFPISASGLKFILYNAPPNFHSVKHEKTAIAI